MEGRERTQRREDSASQTVTSTWMLYNKDTDEMVLCLFCVFASHPSLLILKWTVFFFFLNTAQLFICKYFENIYY